MLRDELDGIFSVDMVDFGFDLPEDEILNFNSEAEEQEEEEKEFHRISIHAPAKGATAQSCTVYG